jgi:putative ABC transport system permease protein
MLTLRRAFRILWRRRLRTLLVSLVLALCVAVFASTIAGVDANEAAAEDIVENYRAAAEATLEETELWMRALVVTGPGGPWSPDGISEDGVDEVASMDDVAGVVPMIMVGFNDEGQTGGGGQLGRGYSYVIHGAPLDPELNDQYHALPVNIVDGRNLSEGDEYTALLSDELVDYFDAGVGDTVNLHGTSLDIVGVYASELWQRDVYMSLSTAQDLLGMQGQLSMLAVYAESQSDVGDVVAEIQSEYPAAFVIALGSLQSQLADFVQQQQRTLMAGMDDDLSAIQTVGLRTIIASGLIAILLIFVVMFNTVRARTKEIGTFKALGFSNAGIMWQFLCEGFYVGLVGGIIGLAIASVAASLLSSWLLGSSENLDIAVAIGVAPMLLGLGLTIVAAGLGSLYPAWRASRVSPMEALRRE